MRFGLIGAEKNMPRIFFQTQGFRDFFQIRHHVACSRKGAAKLRLAQSIIASAVEHLAQRRLKLRMLKLNSGGHESRGLDASAGEQKFVRHLAEHCARNKSGQRKERWAFERST